MRPGSRRTAARRSTDQVIHAQDGPATGHRRSAPGPLRRGAFLVGALSVSLLLGACGGSNQANQSQTQGTGQTQPSETAAPSASGSGAPSAAETTAQALPTTGTPQRDGDADLVIWADNNRAAVLQKFATEFGEENGVKVSIQVSTDVRRDFTTASQTGIGPDVIVGAHDWLGGFVQNDAVAPLNLSPDLVAKFNPAAIAAAKFNGQIYGLPYAVENLALVRNTALAPDAPASLQDLVAKGQELVKTGKATNALLVPVGKTGDAYNAYPFLSAFGGGFFGQKDNGDYDPAKLIVNSPESLKGAQVLADLGKEKVLSTNVDGSNTDALFDTGKVPYYITGPWAIDAAKKAGIKYAISPLPAIDGGGQMQPFLGVQMFYVSAKAKNKALAQEFVTNKMSSVEVQEALFAAGNRAPALTEAYEKVSASNPDVQAWFEAGKGGKPMPNIPAMNAVWGPVGQAEADVVSGKSTPKVAFDAAQKAVADGIKQG